MRVRGLVIGFVALFTAASPSLAHDETEGGQLVGKVNFANSCAPEVQDDLQRAVAMLHSFWFGAGEKTFRAALAKDPGCVIADWGIASLLMQNPLAGVGSPPQWAARAQAALDDAHRTGARTQRENDYIEAVTAYYKDVAQHTERERQAARSKAYEALAARYPEDDEAQIFSALWRWCTLPAQGEMPPIPSGYAMIGWRRTESGRPAANIRFSTDTPMAASVCWAAKPRAPNRGPISVL